MRASARTSRCASSPSSTGRKRGLRSSPIARATWTSVPRRRARRAAAARPRRPAAAARRSRARAPSGSARRRPGRAPRASACAASPSAVDRHAAHRGRRPHERARSSAAARSSSSVGPHAGARPQRRGADLGIRVLQQPVGHRHEVDAAFAREQLQRLQHHGLRRVVEDERRHQPRAALGLQQVDRGQHLVVVGAVERADQRLERGEVDRRQVERGPQRPLAQSHTEHVEVEALQLRHQRDPDERHRRGRAGEHHVAAREEALGQDQDRRERLSAALPDDVDERLRARAHARGERHEQQLGAGAVERVAQRPVDALQQQRRGEPAAERQARGAHEQERRQHPQRAVQADRLEQPAAEHAAGRRARAG